MKIILILFSLTCTKTFAYGFTFPYPQGARSSSLGQNGIIFDPVHSLPTVSIINRHQRDKPISSNSQVIFGTPPTIGTVASDDDMRSSLCPRTPSAEYRFDLDAQKCSKIAQQSHCGKNMIFYSYEDNKVYGHCDCNYNSDIPLVYSEKNKRCYYVYQQAYCKEDQWLELDRKAQPVCSRNKCYNSGRNKFGQKPLASRDIAPEYVPLRGNGKCVLLNKPSEHCKINEEVKFSNPNQFYPSCKNTTIILRHLSIVGTLKCKPGTYLSITGQCQPPFDFDFD